MTANTASFWHDTVNIQPPPSEKLPPHSTVVVLGAGVLGTSTAYWLARAGYAPLVLDALAPAAGATGRNGGHLVEGTAGSYEQTVAQLGRDTARSIWACSVRGRELLEHIIAEEALPCEYDPCGHMTLALRPAELDRFREAAALLQEDGFAATVLDRAAAQQHVGTPLGPQIHGAMLLRGGTLHSARLVVGLAQAAARHGAQFCYPAQAQRIVRDGDGVQIDTSAGTVRAEAVVVALNGYTAALLPKFGGLITPVRGQALAYAPCAPVFRTGMSAGITATGEYWQQRPDGSIVIGGCRASAANGDVGVTDQGSSDDVQSSIEAVLPLLFPMLPPLAVRQRWAGTMGFTASHQPLIAQPADLPNVWVVGGFSGHGMPFGASLGEALAAAIAAGSLPENVRVLLHT